MDKNAIKKYAIYARNKLIQSATDKALTIGVSKNEIRDPDVQGDNYIIFTSSLGTETTLTGDQIGARNKLIKEVNNKGFDEAIEEVAYTWFNRLIAIRFMEVNDYLPSRLRVLSSDISGKKESDLMSSPFDADLNLTDEDKKNIIAYKENNNLNELFNLLFVKQCNKLNELLPSLFEQTNEFTELLLDIRYDDSEDVVYKLVHDIPEENFNVSKGGQVEIIGWLYQYYNTEPKDEVFKGLKKNKKITKENIPAATQLFTPDWIVRYMVENSLGRLWIEGHPDEQLKSNWKYYLDEAEQEPEVQQKLNKIYEEHSHLQPMDIKVIDPAMGSGHILVYMFDVLMQIYESQGYSQRDAAELILENNIYGLDIDKRAYQLSYFSVMMKAREYSRRILTKGTRPHVYEIQETNNFNPEYLHYFGEYEDVGKKLISNFIDAKEYGSILQSNLTKEDVSIIKATIDKAYEMSSLGSFNAQLFTESFLDTIYPLYEQALVLEQKYDVVVTNPPYMGSSGMNKELSDYTKKNYPDSKSDLFAVFIECWNEKLTQFGFNSMVTMQSWMFLSSFEKMRKKTIQNRVINCLMHMDNMVLGIAFGTAVTVFQNSYIPHYKGTYHHIKLSNIKNEKPISFPDYEDRYTQISSDNFAKIPGSPIAYWLNSRIVSKFSHSTISKFGEAKSGMSTTNNTKFLRYWFEVDTNNIGIGYKNILETTDCMYKWYFFAKGGDYRKWYGNYEYIVNWYNNGKDIRKAVIGATGGRLVNIDIAMEFCLTWSKISSSKISFRIKPAGIFFSDAGPGLFIKSNNTYIFGLINSKVAQYIIEALNPTLNFVPGVISSIPVIIENQFVNEMTFIVEQNIDLSRKDWDSFETSWDFKVHPLVRWQRELWDVTATDAAMHYYYGYHPEVSCPLELCYMLWQGECNDRFKKLKGNEEELNKIFIDIYGLQGELTPEEDDKDVTVRKADLGRDIRSLISYAVGCMFGRYSLNEEGLVYAGGDFNIEKYKRFKVDADNIIPITDEEYFNDDIVGRFVDFIKTVYGEDTLEQNLEYIAKALGNRGDTSREVIRNYFEKDFIKDHIKIYKKRPIYWLFDSGKQNGFKALIYMHRYDENTVSNVRTEYLHKVQDVYIKTIEDDQYTIDHSSSKSDVNKARKHIIKLQKQLDETKLYDMALAHIANERISIDLDDGVKVNYAKFQNVEIINDNGKKVKINLLEKI